MAKNVNHIQHVKSSVVENNLPKLPAASALLEGELAVNYAKDKETISLKNSSGEVVTFSSDYYFSEKKLGEAFIGANSATTVSDVIFENERVVAESLNDLNLRKLDVSAYTPTDLTNYYTKNQVDNKINIVSGNVNTLSGTVTAHTANTNVHVTAADKTTWNTVTAKTSQSDFTAHTANTTVHVTDADKTKWNAVTGKADTSAITNFIDSVEYVSNGNAHNIVFYHGTTQIDSIDANDFIKDGMVENATISGSNLVITFNTDAGKQPISIPISSIFNADNYYTKTEVDNKVNTVSGKVDSLSASMSGYVTTVVFENKLGSGFTGENSGNTITKVIEENELVVANAINDLDERKLDASAYTDTDLSNYYTKAQVDDKIDIVSGRVSTLSGNVNTLSGTVTSHTANTDVHVTTGDKATWNTVTAKTNQSDFTAHTANTTVHVTAAERTNWNSVSGKASQTDLNTLSGTVTAHTADTSAHVSNADRTLWNSVSGKADASAIANFIDNVEYVSNGGAHNIVFYHGTTQIDSINANDFIKDGMVENATVSGSNLVITFNTDAGKQPISIPISDIFNADNYYTKTQVDGKIDIVSGRVATLSGSVNTISGKVDTISGNVVTISGKVDTVSGKVDTVSGKVDTVSGKVDTVSGNLETLSGIVIDDELVISSSLNDLDSRIREISAKTGDGVDELVDMIESISGVVEENEIVTAAALNDLNDRKLDASAFTPTDLSNYYTKSEIDNAELATAAALNDLNIRKLDASAYTPTEVSGFVTTQEFEDKLGSGFTGQYSGRTITQAIVEDELVMASALNDLNDRKLDASAYTGTDLSNYYTKSEVDGFVDSLSGIIEDDELVIAASLTDLDSRKLDTSAYTASLSNYYTKDDIDETELAISAALNDLNSKIIAISGGGAIELDSTFSYSGSSASTNAVEAQAIIAYLEEKELTIAAALTDLDSRIDGVAYLSDIDSAISGLTPLSVFDDTVSASTRPVEAQALYNAIADNEYVTSTALNKLNTDLSTLSGTVAAHTANTTAHITAAERTNWNSVSGKANQSDLSQHSGTTIASLTSSQMHLPTVTASDNGKVLMVVNGQWALVSPTTIYTGTGTPSSSQGNDGDIYLQTS